MSRLSRDHFDPSGRLIEGFDYGNQAWVQLGVYLDCGHVQTLMCGCYGRLHKGEETATPEVHTYECQVAKVETRIMWVDVQASSAEQAAAKATIQAEDGKWFFESDGSTVYETIKATERRDQE